MEVGLGGIGEGSDVSKPKSKPRGFGGLALTCGRDEVNRIEEVVEVCDDVGRYSKPGL